MQLHRKAIYAVVGAGSEAFQKAKDIPNFASQIPAKMTKAPDLAVQAATKMRVVAGKAKGGALQTFETYAERGEKLITARRSEPLQSIPAKGSSKRTGSPAAKPSQEAAPFSS